MYLTPAPVTTGAPKPTYAFHREHREDTGLSTKAAGDVFRTVIIRVILWKTRVKTHNKQRNDTAKKRDCVRSFQLSDCHRRCKQHGWCQRHRVGIPDDVATQRLALKRSAIKEIHFVI